jgi:hypothetical protein
MCGRLDLKHRPDATFVALVRVHGSLFQFDFIVAFFEPGIRMFAIIGGHRLTPM